MKIPENFRGAGDDILSAPVFNDETERNVSEVAGNRVRLIAAINYNRRKVNIRAVLTHAEYERRQWPHRESMSNKQFKL